MKLVFVVLVEGRWWVERCKCASQFFHNPPWQFPDIQHRKDTICAPCSPQEVKMLLDFPGLVGEPNKVLNEVHTALCFDSFHSCIIDVL